MRTHPPRKLYLPAVSIIAIVLLMLLIIGVSTYRNFDRQRQTALLFLHRQAVTVLRSIEAGARTGRMLQREAHDAVETMIDETARDDSIRYIYLIDRNGRVAHHSNPFSRGKPADWLPDPDRQNAAPVRQIEQADGSPVLEIAMLYDGAHRTGVPASGDAVAAAGADAAAGHSHAGETLVLGMEMATFEAALEGDLEHSIFMAAILLVLGSGAVFFLFLTQNYYVVNKTLKETRNYAQLVIRSMPNGLLSIDGAGNIVSCNRQAVDMLGLGTSGKPVANLGDMVDLEAAGIATALQEGRSVLDREVTLTKTSGQRSPVGLSVSPIMGEEGIPSGAVLILRDLTHIKQLEEKVRRSEKMAAVGHLAAGVAHEIRNPLSSIRGFVQFLKKSLEGRPREIEYADIIVQEIDRINRVISDLLVFSKPVETELKPVAVSELISHALKLVAADADSHHVAIRSEITACEKPVVVDSSQMTQVLLNLLLNAVHAVGDFGTVTVGARCTTSPARMNLWVADDGPGIPAGMQARIFDPFFTSREEGTGLGLAIVEKIVANHNGEIRITSPRPELGKGCRIDLDIPLPPDKPSRLSSPGTRRQN